MSSTKFEATRVPPTPDPEHGAALQTMSLDDALGAPELAEKRTALREELLVVAKLLSARPTWHLEAVLFEMAARMLDFRPRSVRVMASELINARNWAYGAVRKNPDSRELMSIQQVINEADRMFVAFMREVFARCGS